MYQRFERFSFAISEISYHWHRLTAQEMEKHGLRGSHGVYLLALAGNPEGLTSPQLCEVCGKDKSDVSRRMKAMEEAGMVTKEGGFQNRYGGVYHLTPRGAEIARLIRRRAGMAVEIAGAQLSAQQRAVFYDALDSIASRLRQLNMDDL